MQDDLPLFFLVVRADAKTENKSSNSSYCKNGVVPFVKIRFLVLGGQGKGVRKDLFEGDTAFMFCFSLVLVFVQCACPHNPTMANWQIPVPGQVGVIPATPAPPALDDQQLLIIAGVTKKISIANARKIRDSKKSENNAFLREEHA